MRINPFLKEIDEKFLYLFQLELTPENLDKFRDIRYVIMQGSSKRAANLAKKLANRY